MHASHVEPKSAHASVLSQTNENQSQSPHSPVVGPPNAPLRHVSSLSHHPHPLRAVHASHMVVSSHGSEPHSSGSHCHVAQLPDAGPSRSPLLHSALEAQKPQPARAVHESHESLDAHTSVLSQASENQSQSEHVPTVGPPNEPTAHVSVESHQPQPARSTQAPQAAASSQGSPSVVHTPSSQASPAQQSALVTHVCDPERQAHRPDWQSIQPQQSEDVVHSSPDSTQQMSENGLGRQLRPSQHSEPASHAVRAPPHAPAPHVPPLHVSPEAQSGPEVQQGCPSPPHTPVQVPPVHAPSQATPHAPQCRSSSRVSAHVPPQHASMSAHSSPAQHAWPRPPQVSGTVWQVPPVHASPAPHRIPSQHGSRAPPHATGGRHAPSTHSRPELQVSPSQHG